MTVSKSLHWQLLVFDPSDPEDPRWLIATVTAVRQADVDDTGRRYTDWRAVTRWVRSVLRRPEVNLTPVERMLAWQIRDKP
jgi:hypothetical protein